MFLVLKQKEVSWKQILNDKGPIRILSQIVTQLYSKDTIEGTDPYLSLWLQRPQDNAHQIE